MNGARICWTIIRHDVRREVVRPLTLVGALLFGVAALVIVHLAIAGSGRVGDHAALGTLWVVIIFAALLALGRALVVDVEGGMWDAWRLAPAARTTIFLAKVVSSTALMMVLHTLIVAMFLVLFPSISGANMLTVWAIVLIADVGMAAAGVLVAAISLHARARELVTATLLLPLCIPVLLAGATASISVVDAGGIDMQALAFLAGCDLVFVALGIGTFEDLAVE